MNEADTAGTDLDSSEGFDEGFANAPSAPTTTPGQQREDDPTEIPAVEYAQLTRAQYDDLLALKATQEKSFGTAFGKLGGIERTLQQLQSAPQVDIEQADIDALREDFPPLAAALEKVRNLRAIGGNGLDPGKLDEMVQQRIAPALDSINDRVAQAVELRLLSKQHPDFKEVDADPAFAAWVQAQPEKFRTGLAQASASYDSEAVASAITAFKQSRKSAAPGNDPAAVRRARLSAGITPKGGGGFTGASPNDDFDSGFAQERGG